MLAVDGAQWCSIFRRYNSGTYNNLWMIVDYNKIDVNPQRGDEQNTDERTSSALKPGTLWLLEQTPPPLRGGNDGGGNDSDGVTARDATPHLQKHGYWASYNVPFYAATRAVSAFDSCL
jgi:hypothetical protein